MPIKDYIKTFFWVMLLGASIAMVAAIINAPVARGSGLEAPLYKVVNAEPTYTVPHCELPFKVNTSQYMDSFNTENGLTFVVYRTGKDALFVVVLVTEDANNQYPLFYGIGRTRGPDKTWVDQHRDGTCDGVVEYWTNPKLEV